MTLLKTPPPVERTSKRTGAAGSSSLDPSHGGSPERSLSSSMSPDNRYAIQSTLGRGATGVVYKVRDQVLDEVVALKVLDPTFSDSGAAFESFKHEIKVTRRLSHPNIARLFDLVIWRERVALSQQFIDGRDLDAVLKQGPLTLSAAVHYLRYIAAALDYAHGLGVVHGDLKPGNIVVDGEDHPYVVDFGTAVVCGSARHSAATESFGTPWYMSPEQIREPQRVDHRADVYGLGIMLYRMTTGEFPFEAGTPKQVLEAHLQGTPRPPSAVRPDLPERFDDVMARCLAKQPERRYASAGKVFAALKRYWEADAPSFGGDTPCKVLVVDDDRNVRWIVREVLSSRGIQVVEASNGFAGVETALKEQPHLVFLDRKMPKLDGLEALRILKSNGKTAETPVVIMSDDHDAEEALFCQEVGAVFTLNKPVHTDVLGFIVERYVGR